MASSAPWQRRSSKAVSSDTAKTSSRGSTTRRRPLSASCRERISGSCSCASAPIRRGERRKHKMTARDSSRVRTDDSDLPDPERQLLGRARALIPRLAERAPATTAKRNVTPETIAEYHDAGILKILQPRRFGGLQGRFSLFSQIVEALTEGCASSAWVYAVLGEHQWIIASYPLQAQIDVWGDNPLALTASSLAPRAAATRVAGGWRLSGQYSFSSGSSHAHWAIIGAFLGPAGDPRSIGYLLVPFSDIEIIDDWHVLGLAGTGSRSLMLRDVFVAE